MALTKTPIELSSTPSIVDGGNATAITIDSSENVTFAGEISTAGVNTITSNTPKITFIESDQSNKQYQIGSFGAAYAIYDASNSQYRYTLTTSGDHIFNEGGLDCDFRVESNNNANMLFVDGGNDRVGIGIGTPATTLDIRTSNGSDAKLRIGSSSSIGLDVLGTIEFFSADADDSGIKASIHNLSTGNQGPGGSLSGNLIFSTTASDGGGNDSPTERMRIQSDGDFFLNTTSAMANCFASFQDGNNGEAMFGISAKNDSNVGIRLGVGTDRKWVMYRNTSDDLIFYNNASSGERVRFLDAGGIAFNGDTAAANALDDYEEGTATLTMSAITTAPTITQGNTFTINYTKIGNLVRFVGYSGARNITNVGTGGAKFTGLPFAQAGSYYGHVTFAHSTTFATDVAVGYIENGNTFFYPITLSSTSAANYQTGTRYVMVQGFYHTA